MNNMETEQITVKEAVECIEKLNQITGKQFYFKANKGGIKLMEEDSEDCCPDLNLEQC